MAGATSTLILYPLDVVRSRLTVSSAKQSAGLLSTFHTIASKEGVPALYKGLGPSLLSIIPEAAITYGCFDLLKEGYRKATGGKEAGVVPSLACGVLSAFTGTASKPIHVLDRCTPCTCVT
jgi:solute carrier family 25 (mitochondrial phosphate transporter), member 23/24/25/41